MMKKEDDRRRESNVFLWLDWVGGPLVKASSPHTHRRGGPSYQGVQSDRMKPLSKQPPMSRFVYCLLFFNLFNQCRQPAQFHL